MKLYKIDLLWIDENHGVDVGEIIICCIDDGDDGDEVGLWGKGGDPISIVCVKSLKGCCFSRSGMLGRVSVDVKGENHFPKMDNKIEKLTALAGTELILTN